MWIVEVNVLGHTFTQRVGDHHRALKLTPRIVQLRQLKVRFPRTAA